ncbi:Protein of unknown function, partial [Gryllus bimaculatus]
MDNPSYQFRLELGSYDPAASKTSVEAEEVAALATVVDANTEFQIAHQESNNEITSPVSSFQLPLRKTPIQIPVPRQTLDPHTSHLLHEMEAALTGGTGPGSGPGPGKEAVPGVHGACSTPMVARRSFFGGAG